MDPHCQNTFQNWDTHIKPHQYILKVEIGIRKTFVNENVKEKGGLWKER